MNFTNNNYSYSFTKPKKQSTMIKEKKQPGTRNGKSVSERMKEIKERKRKTFGILLTDDLKEKHEALYKITGLREPSELHRFAVTALYRNLVLKING